MVAIKKIKVALNLDRQSVPVKIEKGRHYVTSITGNANFTTPNPTLPSVTTAVNNLETAFNNADGGGKEETAIMHEKKTIVDHLLTLLGAYVEGIANNDAPNAVSIALSAGMTLKKPNAPIGTILAPQNLKGKFGRQAGHISLSCKRSVGARAMIWQKKSGAAPVEDFEPAGNAEFPGGVTLSSKHIVTGLVSGTSYTFRVAAVGRANQSGWSDIVVQMSP